MDPFKPAIRTAKYRPEYPSRSFADLAAARALAKRFVHWSDMRIVPR